MKKAIFSIRFFLNGILRDDNLQYKRPFLIKRTIINNSNSYFIVCFIKDSNRPLDFFSFLIERFDF